MCIALMRSWDQNRMIGLCWLFVKRIHRQENRDRYSPLGAKWSGGQADELPVQFSGKSHLASFASRQTCVDGAKEHCAVQQGVLAGSQIAPDVNLQVAESQHLDVTLLPGSQSSPASTMPLPHIWSDMTCLFGSGSTTQVTANWLPPPNKEPGVYYSVENKAAVSQRTYVAESTWRKCFLCGLRNRVHDELRLGIACRCWRRTTRVSNIAAGSALMSELAKQWNDMKLDHTSCFNISGQRQQAINNVTLHTIAPKLWPISWATTCHSVRPYVETAVPETDWFELPGEAFVWHLR